MTLVDALAKRIPKLYPVDSVSQGDIEAISATPKLHSGLVLMDAASGLLWAHVPYMTISARTAATLLWYQEYADIRAAPLWALVLGVALETRWVVPFVSYPGHLQDALKADAARQTQGLLLTAPALASRIVTP